jgi:hypothetical protein
MSYYADHSWEEDRWKNKKKKMKWKPKLGGNYYFISDEFKIVKTWLSFGIPNENTNIKIGNCFRTRKQAQQMAKKIKEILKGGSNG